LNALDLFVDRVRAQWPDRKVPAFDPKDGGAAAKVLFLLEAPGPRAVKSGLISRNNPDQTARAFNELLAEASIFPAETLLWNVVPWYIGNPELTKIRPARVADLKQAEPHLAELLGLLQALRAVVLVGRKARHKSVRTLIERKAGGRIEVFECYHPSPLVLNGRPHNRTKILDELKKVRRALDNEVVASTAAPLNPSATATATDEVPKASDAGGAFRASVAAGGNDGPASRAARAR